MQTKGLKVKVYAKINLSLNILGVCDKMHMLDMIMTSVDLADVLSIYLRDDNNINISFDNPDLNNNTNTTVHKAVAELKKNLGEFGLDIHVQKNIPLLAGVGGSSADAAAIIRAVPKILDKQLTKKEEIEIGKKVGSDVAFQLYGGVARVTNLGEIIEQIKTNLNLKLLIVKPNSGVSSKDSFTLFDSLFKDKKLVVADNDSLKQSIVDNDFVELTKHCNNALQKSSAILCPIISSVLDDFTKNTKAKTSFMTGSGSACVGVFSSNNDVINALDFFKNKYQDKLDIFITTNKHNGIEFL